MIHFLISIVVGIIVGVLAYLLGLALKDIALLELGNGLVRFSSAIGILAGILYFFKGNHNI